MNRDLNYFLRESGARITQTLFMEAHYIFSKEDLEKFFKLATEWEREQCAKVCEELDTGYPEHFACEFAADIRARGDNNGL